MQAAAILLATIAMLAASGCGPERSSTGTRTIYGSQEANLPALTSSYLRQFVDQAYGEAALVRDASLSGEGLGRRIDITVDRPPNAGNGSIEGVMAAFSGKVLAELFQYPEVDSVTISMYGTSPGEKSDEVALKITVDRATAAANDWSMFGPMTMSDMVSSYYMNPKLTR